MQDDPPRDSRDAPRRRLGFKPDVSNTPPSRKRAPRVLALSSRVARGRVGLSIAVPALEALGCEVLALATIHLASRPGLGRAAGYTTPPDALVEMIDALEADGALARLDAVLTGYAPTRDHVLAMAHAVARARACSPQARIVCDPVLGDQGRVYLEAEAAEAMRADLAPLADVITPNAFEIAWLDGAADRPASAKGDAPTAKSDAPTLADLEAMARRHPARAVVVTSAPAMLRGHMGALLVAPGAVLMAEARAAPVAPNGTGDLFGAVLTAHLARELSLERALERSVAAVHGVTLRSHRAGAEHLLVTEERDELTSPTLPVSVRRLGGRGGP